MTTRRTKGAVVAVVAAVSLVLAACGTRLGHDTIVRAAAGSGTGAGTGEAAPGEAGTPGDPEAAPGEARAAGAGDAAGDAGAGDAAGDAGSAGAAPGQAGKPGAAGRNGDGGPAGGAPIVIGSVGTYSGPVGSLLRQGPVALRAWAAATNAKGGINGRPIKVIIYDDGGDAARARSQVQELVETHKAVALVAALGGTASVKAWKGYVEQSKVPTIGGPCTQTFWNESPVLFNQCPSLDSSLYGTVFLGAKHAKGKKFGALFCTETEACSHAENGWFSKGYARRAGLDPVYRARISLTQPDYTSECIQARNAGVQILSVTGDLRTTERVVASCRRQNFNPQFLQYGLAVGAETPRKPGLGDVLSPQLVFPFAGLSSPAFKEFDATWKKYSREGAGPAATLAWAAAKIFEKAARNAKDISRAGLIKALYGFKNQRFGGLTVPLSYGPHGTADSRCVFYLEGRGGKWAAPDGDKLTCW